MKKLILHSTIILLLLPIYVFPQWYQVNSGTTESLYSVIFPTDNIGLAVGMNGTLIKTTDGGENWSVQNNLQSTSWLTSIDFSGNDYFALCGFSDAVFITSDGGNNWINKSTGYNDAWIDIDFPTINDVWLVSINFAVARSTDRGNTWNIYQLPYPGMGMPSAIEANGEIAYVTYNITGEIYVTTNGGATWELKHSGNNYGLEDLYEEGGGLVTAVGHYGIVLQSSDYGQTWYVLTESDFSEGFYNAVVYGSLDGIGWVAGTENGVGIIRKTSDDGLNWYSQEMPIIQDLNDITWYGIDNLWVVGANGIILKTINGGGVTAVENDNNYIKDFILGQNYPNPFNPNTTIKYTIPKASFVSLKIYDLIGKEIATLVNGEKPIGDYEIEFIGNNLPSGIYLYKMQAGNFSDTKKLILLK